MLWKTFVIDIKIKILFSAKNFKSNLKKIKMSEKPKFQNDKKCQIFIECQKKKTFLFLGFLRYFKFYFKFKSDTFLLILCKSILNFQIVLKIKSVLVSFPCVT